MWFVDQGTTKALGYVTPSGAITEIPLSATSNPNSVRTGPDGNVWFTDQRTPKAIGMINPTTHAVQEFSAGMTAGEPVTLTANTAGLQIVGATVEGPLTVTGNDGTIVDSPNTVHGPSHLQ
jgi:streptogramin lyase